MDDIIRILPEAVANQIAAGEVVQRPASVIKELMENAIDAGATQIDVRVKDAGRTLIQVVDNGKGMSPADARTAFLRHATSKLMKADDLFHLKTMGFRGEALASIAAVAQVELVTRRASDELAWKVEIEGNTLIGEEPTLAAQGSRFSVRNLFFNIPARRKFLNDNNKELKAIRDEFIQIALIYPDVSMGLTHNEEVLYQLMPGTLKQRLLTVFGKRSGGQLNKQLYPVQVNTPLITIHGFVGDPQAACQRDPLQYFFVNNRFIRHKYFRSAVLKAYETLLPNGMHPLFFLFFEVAPEALDVNIHPTKTEVKFEHEQAIWPIIHATVREALGKFNAIPSIDFDKDDAPDIRVFESNHSVAPPKVSYNPGYNPFNATQPHHQPDWGSLNQGFHNESDRRETVYQEGTPEENTQHAVKENANATFQQEAVSLELGKIEALFDGVNPEIESCTMDIDAPKFQLFGTFIALNCKNALVLIHQQRAHLRILYDRYLRQLALHKSFSQTLMFPVPLMLNNQQRLEFDAVHNILQSLGFKFELSSEAVDIVAVPMEGEGLLPDEWVLELMQVEQVYGLQHVDGRSERMALKMAKMAAIPGGRFLMAEEMEDLVLRLSETNEPTFTPDGKRILLSLTLEELLKRF